MQAVESQPCAAQVPGENFRYAEDDVTIRRSKPATPAYREGWEHTFGRLAEYRRRVKRDGQAAADQWSSDQTVAAMRYTDRVEPPCPS